MKQLISITITILIFASTNLRGAILAGPFTNPSNAHLYFLLSTNVPQLAEAEAVSLGGHLVTINDASEQEWVFSKFGPLAGSHRMWIGLTDSRVNGRWEWMSGEPFIYQHSDEFFPAHNAGATNGPQHFCVMYPPNFSRPGFWGSRAEWEQAGVGSYSVAEVIPGQAAMVTVFPAVQIAWSTRTTNTYQVQWSSLINSNNWFSLGSPVQGTGSTNYQFDSTLEPDKRFYRVLTLP
jgi:hypothetical protein